MDFNIKSLLPEKAGPKKKAKVAERKSMGIHLLFARGREREERQNDLSEIIILE